MNSIMPDHTCVRTMPSLPVAETLVKPLLLLDELGQSL